MPLPSFLERFRRGPTSATSDAVSMSSSDVEAMRVRARRRLIGMVVLVGAGVVGFPWLFETKPRPMSGDIQIVQAQQAPQPSGSGSVTGATIAAVTAPAAPAARVAPPEAEREEFVTDAPPKPAVVPSVPVAKPAASKPAAVAASKPTPKPAEKPVDKPAAKAADKVKEKSSEKAAEKASDKPADKAKDKPADKKSDKDKADKDKPGTRYVVQFGAFADANSAHEARMKAERLGLKTYAQQVDTPQGKRIRVRLGPYADKAEADKAAASLRKAGLPGAVLTL
ncbi:SPOR domain-containing protein [Aquabacterium sp.]|uniref:SPOR domain-containing protein n=1 Tax=Aquabacterium sp. TaxID=1872578 RepID=UPI0024889BAA|nr:SPOR domain-containing protein [Aquabacterium sp.]MDI1349283.1 SPOR domain-containing protein [Aquabacterium sp.]